ncbi:LacI family transcriptional regulator [Rothia sp. AR01]|uniref:LacI family transcriptional regulator n=1 Tax=Rothia santali TaxID=2949643 RepID=A0A9X2HIM8_9MICC|nr:LacI family DNA-binding transcriptional regulator [Rothia santali]MCP3426391.1 LacI family transcriptional regulator [Rothia santali]
MSADATPRAPASPQGPPTMKSIAERVGVSRQLVSIVLREQPGASEETRRRVFEAARELGYHPNASARALRGKRTRRVGVVFTMRQPFEVDLVEALFGAAEARGFTLVLAPLTSRRGHDAVMGELQSQRVEGMVVLGAEHGGARIEGLPAGVPAVMLGGPTSEESLDDVRVDDGGGTRLVVEHLLALGHTRIAYVTGGDGPNSEIRRAAYEDALRAHGLSASSDVVPGHYTEEGGAEATLRLLSRPELPTAVVGGNDRIAMGVLGTLVRHGLRVPEDVSVAGFDDASLSRLPYVDLTTVGYDPVSLAERAVEAVIRRIEEADAAPVAHREPPHLLVRSSTAAPRRRSASCGGSAERDETGT